MFAPEVFGQTKATGAKGDTPPSLILPKRSPFEIVPISECYTPYAHAGRFRRLTGSQ